MQSLETDFRKLQELLGSKEGDFRRHFKITTTSALSIYDILNSPRVDGYLKGRSQLCDPLTPGRVNAAITERRLLSAYDIARSKDLQTTTSRA
jgi:hypothetical protein